MFYEAATISVWKCYQLKGEMECNRNRRIDSIVTIAMFRFRFTQPLLCCGNASADMHFLSQALNSTESRHTFIIFSILKWE